MLPCKIHNYVLLGKHYIPSHDVRSSEEVLRKFCGSMWPLCAADDQQAGVKLQKAASSNLFCFRFSKNQYYNRFMQSLFYGEIRFWS